ncbi:MAG: carboxymuconolactone decarboxylase family protein [Hyphomicrobiaceae bacterium]
MGRQPTFDVKALTPEQQRIHDEMVAGPRGTVPAPQQIWLNNPDFCDVAHKLGEYCRYRTSFPTHLSEIAILCVGQHWRSDYEWWAHARIAREAGVPDSIIEALRRGEEPDFSNYDPKGSIIVRAVREMLTTKRLSELTFREAEATLGRTGLVDLVGIAGYYCLISLTLNVFEVKTPDASRPFFDLASMT